MRDVDSGLVSLDGLEVDIALMRSYPSILDQRFVAAPGRLRERRIGFRLLHCGLQLRERGLVLRNLVVELGHCELCEQFALLDVIPDIDVALGNVAGGTGVDVGGTESCRGARQRDGNDGWTCLDRRDKHGRREVARLIGCLKRLPLLRVVTRGAERDAGGQQQEGAEGKDASAPAAPRSRARF